MLSHSHCYPHQLFIDEQLAKADVTVVHGQVVKLLGTQIALVEANEEIAVIPSFSMFACRNRKVTMSKLIDPVVNLDFYQITSRGTRMSDEAKEFSALLKMYIASSGRQTRVSYECELSLRIFGPFNVSGNAHAVSCETN
ncbi:MAG TPA: hypothetical protein VHX63_13920 [Acidobacteriaceae bacterium]|jgi:hypothetical protein|nr:hypothetical protein [Acidobacteriaceae bacterium]